MLILFFLPVLFAVLHRLTRKYLFSPCVTLSAAVICLIAGFPVLFFGLCISALGDWFLQHERGRTAFFLGGVGGFFTGHLCFGVHSLLSGGCSAASLLFSAVLFALLGCLLLRRVYGGIPGRAMRIAVVLYAAVSCFSFGLSLNSGFSGVSAILYPAGIFMILFSDCLIALSRFGSMRKIGRWIMPTYFSCHILLAAAALAGNLF